jgi:hypothetical protein
MYAWSNDNDTETELTPAELGQYEYASTVIADATTSLPESNQSPLVDSKKYQSVMNDAQAAAQTAHEHADDTTVATSKSQESTATLPSPDTESERAVESYGSDLVRIMAEDGMIISTVTLGSSTPAGPLSSPSRPRVSSLTASDINPAHPESTQVGHRSDTFTKHSL